MKKMRPGVALTVLLASAMTSSAADDTSVQFASGDERVALLELFTSEGCSSCPPADRWLSKQKADERLWRDYIPIAFHVDYWDYIGWKDRFASKDNSDRQRRYILEGGARVAYTPEFFNNGKEWLDWRTGGSVVNGSEYAGNLSLNVTDDRVAVHFDNAQLLKENLWVHVAVLGMNLETDVRAGENKARKLKHDFVALSVVSTALKRSSTGFEVVTQVPLTIIPAADKALVAWVSSADAQRPLQAVGGLLPNGAGS